MGKIEDLSPARAGQGKIRLWDREVLVIDGVCYYWLIETSSFALSFPRLGLSFSSSITLVLPDIGAFSSLVVGTFVLVPSLALLLHLTDVLTLVLDNTVPGPLPPRGTNLGTGGLSGQNRRQQGQQQKETHLKI